MIIISTLLLPKAVVINQRKTRFTKKALHTYRFQKNPSKYISREQGTHLEIKND